MKTATRCPKVGKVIKIWVCRPHLPMQTLSTDCCTNTRTSNCYYKVFVFHFIHSIWELVLGTLICPYVGCV